MADEIIQQQRQAPYIEKRSEQLLASVFGDPNAVKKDGETEEAFQLRKLGRAGIAQQIPGYEFAGFTPEQKQAFGLASQQVIAQIFFQYRELVVAVVLFHLPLSFASIFLL